MGDDLTAYAGLAAAAAGLLMLAALWARGREDVAGDTLEDARLKGAYAFDGGLGDKDDNPYDLDTQTELHQAWLAGFRDAERDW